MRSAAIPQESGAISRGRSETLTARTPDSSIVELTGRASGAARGARSQSGMRPGVIGQERAVRWGAVRPL